MALQGNLRDFSTTQLLNLVNLARKTGSMTIEAENDKASLFFRDGKLIHASTNKREGRLADMLIFSGKLGEEQLQRLSNSQNLSDKALGINLIKSGTLKQQDIVQSVKQFMLDIVFSLFSWKEGQFDFRQDVHPAADKITIPLNLDNVILEGNRQLQENERLLDELPDLTVIALQITDKPLKDVKLTPDDWRVISQIHPRHTVEQIAQANAMDEIQVRKVVYGMLQAGLVELIKPEGFQPKQTFQARSNKQQPLESAGMKRSVVERLITRIKRI